MQPTYSTATQSTNGLLSAADKKKLDGIATGANKTTVDSALSSCPEEPPDGICLFPAVVGWV